MSENPRQLLKEVLEGAEALKKLDTKRMNAWGGVSTAAYKADVLDTKTKELMAVAIAVAIGCKECLVHHVYRAFKLGGATREELMETAFTAIGMSGGPGVTKTCTILLDAVNEFAPEFGK